MTVTEKEPHDRRRRLGEENSAEERILSKTDIHIHLLLDHGLSALVW